MMVYMFLQSSSEPQYFWFPMLLLRTMVCGCYLLQRKMFQTNFAFFVAIWLSFFNLNFVELRKVFKDALPSTTHCQYPCLPLAPPPPLSDYPLYGSPPPPSLLPSNPVYGTPPPPAPLSGYRSYGAPPSQANCTPVPVQCCYYPPPHPLGFEPEENYSASCPPFNFISAMVLLLYIAILL